jgi:hypothetical protein
MNAMDDSIDKLADDVMAMLKEMNAMGASRAVLQSKVAKACDTDTRSIQQATLRLNERGVPVVTSCVKPFGMFIAESVEELGRYAEQLRARLLGNAMRCKFVLRMVRAMNAAAMVESTGQRRLFA